MKHFIAYFDLLGFKKLIFNNSLTDVSKHMSNLFLGIENAKGRGNKVRSPYGVVTTDISNSKLRCVNFSDTIVFWSNDDSLESLKEITAVAHDFNEQCITSYFPLRGILCFDEGEYIEFDNKNDVGGSYHISTLYGAGIINAYLKAESLNWAGSVIDITVVDQANKLGLIPEDFFKPYAITYPVPYKNQCKREKQLAFRLVKNNGISEEFFNTTKDLIDKAFRSGGKDADNRRVKTIFKNTIKFLKMFQKK